MTKTVIATIETVCFDCHCKMKTNLPLVLLAAVISFAVVTAKSKGSKKQAPQVGPEEDYADAAGPETEENVVQMRQLSSKNGSLVVNPDDPRVQAAEMQAKIEQIHAKDPRDRIQLAQLVLTQAFLNFSQGENEVSVPSILKELMNSPPRTSMYIVRLLEILDRDSNYKIDVEEFQWVFAPPVSETSLFGGLFFKLQDYDGDGIISRYDLLTDEILSLGVNYNLFDMWRAATQKLAEADLNRDNMLDPAELANHVLFQVNRALVQRRDGTLN